MGLKHARTREKGKGAEKLRTSSYLLIVLLGRGWTGICNLEGVDWAMGMDPTLSQLGKNTIITECSVCKKSALFNLLYSLACG
jgi:hypothetical protein